MRLIIFVLKCIVGILATVGLIIVGGGAAVFFLAEDLEDSWKHAEVEPSDKMVLMLDLSDGLAESPDEVPFASIGWRRVSWMPSGRS